MLQTVEFFDGVPPRKGYYLVARYRSNKSPTGAGSFIDVKVVFFDGGHWAVDWQSAYFIEFRYWSELPGDPEKESD